MLKYILHKAIAKFEKETRYNADYLHQIVDSHPFLAIKFSSFKNLSGFRKKAPLEIYHICKLAAVKYEDCGPCLQLSIHYALEDGVSPAIVKAAVHQPELLTDEQKLAYDFAFAVVSQSDSSESLYGALEAKLGKNIMVELAMAIATIRVYPTLKRGMGLARSCQMTFEFAKEKTWTPAKN